MRSVNKVVIFLLVAVSIAAIGLVLQEKTAYIVEYPEMEDFPVETQAACIYIVNNSDNYINNSEVICQDFYNNTHIIINASNIELDCNNSVFDGVDKTGIAIYANLTNNVSVYNCNITRYAYSMYFNGSNFSSINDNYIFNTSTSVDGSIMLNLSNNVSFNNNVMLGPMYVGIRALKADNLTLVNNNMSGMSRDAIYVWSSKYSIVHSNFVNTTNEGIGISTTTAQGLLSYGHVVYNNTVVGGNLAEAIYFYNTTDGLVYNNSLTGHSDGVAVLFYSHRNNITNNSVTSNTRGIQLDRSANNTLISNTANIDNVPGTTTKYGIYLSSSHNNTLTNNTANTNNSINTNGIYLTSSNNNILISNTINNNTQVGIALYSGSNNSILINNTANSNYVGIVISGLNNILTNNTINSNQMKGIAISEFSNNTLSNNAVSNSYYGIEFFSSQNNTLTNNILDSNSECLRFVSSPNNTLFNNYFDNSVNVILDNAGGNYWNTTYNCSVENIIGGPCFGGNYWSDYTGDDTDGDGIGDTEIPYNSSNIIVGGDYLPLVLGGLEIIRFELTPNETYSRKDFEMSVLINNSGNAKMTNNTLWFTLDGNDWMNSNGVVPDLLPGESYEFETTAFIEDINEHNITVYLNSSLIDSDESDNYASDIIFLRTAPSGGASGPSPIVQPIVPPASPTPPMTRESIATFPKFRISFLNCTLKDKTFNIPPEGATVVLQGSLDDKSQPTPGTAAVLLYPSNISGNETKPMYISKIECIEPEQYAIVHCNQSVIASYEVDVTADLSYLCINYEGTESTPESVTINLNEAGEWKPVTITNVLHNVDKKIICGNITGHTPYMVSGFVPKPEIVSAMEAIDALESAINDNCPAEVCAEAETLLEQAKQAYESCDYSKALTLANQGRALFVSQKSLLIWIILTIVIVAGVSTIYFYTRKKK